MKNIINIVPMPQIATPVASPQFTTEANKNNAASINTTIIKNFKYLFIVT